MNKSKVEKRKIGQFFTPITIARFMTQLLTFNAHSTINLLDAGAGEGILTDAAIELIKEIYPKEILNITQFETDKTLLSILQKKYENHNDFIYKLWSNDYIEKASEWISKGGNLFTHAIQNPPYKKIKANSKHREDLRSVGIETVNLYSGFVSLTLLLLQDKGELVAIIPRSFCNGPYYKPFRELILKTASIDRIHLFDSRIKPFRDEEVLQESMIVKFTKTHQKQNVIVSHSTDGTFSDIEINQYNFSEIVKPNDKEKFIHIPRGEQQETIMKYEKDLISLTELGITVSTGPVVDFRIKDLLSSLPCDGSVPLIYPANFKDYELVWPNDNLKKPNAILNNSDTKKWLYPAEGTFVVVNRFSAKEEKRRVVANIIEAEKLHFSKIGIENHLNVFHISKKGLTKSFAYGLAVYLNSELVDRYVRIFNGHTQINATDLRNLKYPQLEALEILGEFYLNNKDLSDKDINRKVVEVIELRKPYRRNA